MDYRGERNDADSIVSGSRQIYLTFPAESTFTKEDYEPLLLAAISLTSSLLHCFVMV
ncbi:hypothetical protein MKX03_034371, partial [Papaver bracteatum]